MVVKSWNESLNIGDSAPLLTHYQGWHVRIRWSCSSQSRRWNALWPLTFWAGVLTLFSTPKGKLWSGAAVNDQLLQSLQAVRFFFLLLVSGIRVINTVYVWITPILIVIICRSLIVTGTVGFVVGKLYEILKHCSCFTFSPLSSRFSSQVRTLNLPRKGQQSLSQFWRADIRSSIPISGFGLIHMNPLHPHRSQTLTWALGRRGNCESKREIYEECGHSFFKLKDLITDLQLNHLHVNTVKPEWLLWIDGWGIWCRLESQGFADNNGNVSLVGNLTTQSTGFFYILQKHEWDCVARGYSMRMRKINTPQLAWIKNFLV